MQTHSTGTQIKENMKKKFSYTNVKN